MRFIPLEYLIINTLLPPPEARARLIAALDPGTTDPAVPLSGRVGLATFVLRRTRQPRWALPMEFRGRIEQRGKGTRLTGMVSTDVPPVLALALAGLAAFGAAVEPLTDVLAGEAGGGADVRRLAPLGIVIVAWVLAVRGVIAEAQRVRQLVNRALGSAAGGGPSPPHRAP